MSDLIVIQPQVTTLTVTEDVNQVVVSSVGVQGATGATGPKGDTGDTGPQGPSGVIAVTAPITNSGTSTSANIGINTATFAMLASANTFTGGVQQITVPSAATKGLIVRGASGQTSNLQEWQNSAGTSIASISSIGVISAARYIFSNNNWNTSAEGRERLYFVNAGGNFYKGTDHGFRNNSDVTIFSLSGTGGAAITLTTAATIGLIVKAAASHTGNLTEWQNSGATILTSITSAGTINFASGNTSATATAGAIIAPALVTGFITMQIAGTTVKVPYYSN
jgi:hypothetical protein